MEITDTVKDLAKLLKRNVYPVKERLPKNNEIVNVVLNVPELHNPLLKTNWANAVAQWNKDSGWKLLDKDYSDYTVVFWESIDS